jgi:hypothetical protein
LAVLALAGLTLTGCSNALETGYVPRRLGANATERRGYYASPFTPEAQAAAQAQTTDTNSDIRGTSRRPGGGGFR